MLILISLSDQEEAGIRKYLTELSGKPVYKTDIQKFIQGIVTGVIHAPKEAVSKFIKTA